MDRVGLTPRAGVAVDGSLTPRSHGAPCRGAACQQAPQYGDGRLLVRGRDWLSDLRATKRSEGIEFIVKIVVAVGGLICEAS